MQSTAFGRGEVERVSGPLLDRIDIQVEVPRRDASAEGRILKLARTIADLPGSASIETPHLAEAIQYRPRRQV